MEYRNEQEVGSPTLGSVQSQIKDFQHGIICVCEYCGKIDINPYKHFANCSPKKEADKSFYENNLYST